jgi:hypothetical protein
MLYNMWKLLSTVALSYIHILLFEPLTLSLLFTSTSTSTTLSPRRNPPANTCRTKESQLHYQAHRDRRAAISGHATQANNINRKLYLATSKVSITDTYAQLTYLRSKQSATTCPYLIFLSRKTARAVSISTSLKATQNQKKRKNRHENDD